MTQPDIASQQPRLCPRDGYALVLDDVIARTAIDAGGPAVALWRGRRGHSHRDWPPEQMAARRTDPSVRKPCAVCGRPLPRKPRLHGSGGRKYCPGPCTAFVTLARYKFVAKMLAGKGPILEIGCADGFGTRLVAQGGDLVVGIDADPVMLHSAERTRGTFRIAFRRHDLLDSPFGQFRGAFAIDVLEHIPPSSEEDFMRHAARSLHLAGILILGTPSRESQPYASEPSREGHRSEERRVGKE